MLDTHSQKFVRPILTVIARLCLRLGISANALTLAGLIVGLSAAGLVACGLTVAGIVVLWVSGVLDAADGTLARLTETSAIGAIMDITFDRIVEVALIFALAWRFPEARLALLALTAIIVVGMSMFLSIAAALANHSTKSFHYAPGLAERTEGFIFLSLMALDPARLVLWTLLFAAAIVFTMLQRFVYALTALASDSEKRRNGLP